MQAAVSGIKILTPCTTGPVKSCERLIQMGPKVMHPSFSCACEFDPFLPFG